MKKSYEVYKTSGIKAAKRHFLDLVERESDQKDFGAYHFIRAYSILQDKDRLMDVLERCYRERLWPYNVNIPSLPTSGEMNRCRIWAIRACIIRNVPTRSTADFVNLLSFILNL